MKLSYKSGKGWIKLLIAVGMAGLMCILLLSSLLTGNVYAQQPTGNVPTVTGTPAGPYVTVYSDQAFIDVFAGPSNYDYAKIGIMAAGTSAPALGFSQDNNWIEIVYMGVTGDLGWVYAPFVSITTGSLPRLNAPPTPAPLTTPTLNPTFVAAYGLQVVPTRLPTYTAPAPLKLPTFAPNAVGVSKVPYGLVILVLALIGILGAMISFLRGNR
jgi:hypothetical protein